MLIAQKIAKKIAFLRSRSSLDLLTKWRSPIAISISHDLPIIWSKLTFENKPPCMTRTRSLIQWHKGSQLYTSVNKSTIFAEYFALTSPSKPYILFMFSLSWFPRDIKKWFGYKSLKLKRTKMHSTEKLPRSTKSPLKR